MCIRDSPETANAIRVVHGEKRITTDFRFQRVIPPAFAKKIPKVRFATEAVNLLVDAVPEPARPHVDEIAAFVKASNE